MRALLALSRSSPASQVGAAHLQRVKLPRFDGKPENWGEFKRKFKELTKTINCSPVLELTYLAEQLSEAAGRYIVGITDPAKAWAALDKRYGDRRLIIMTTRNRLVHLKLPKGPPHDQVEALVQGLAQARTALEAVGAADHLFSDLGMVGTLLGKLPAPVQAKWYDRRVDFPADASAAEEGQMFEQWLEREGDAAMHQRLTVLATELGRGPAPEANEKQACGKSSRT